MDFPETSVSSGPPSPVVPTDGEVPPIPPVQTTPEMSRLRPRVNGRAVTSHVSSIKSFPAKVSYSLREEVTSTDAGVRKRAMKAEREELEQMLAKNAFVGAYAQDVRDEDSIIKSTSFITEKTNPDSTVPVKTKSRTGRYGYKGV